MYAQTAINPNTLHRNGATDIVMRGVQKCTRGCSSLSGRKRLSLCCIKLDTATDPCCGSGGMFVQSAKFVESHSGNINDISVYGQDSNPTTWKMAQMNLAIRGIDADLGKFNADTFFNDCHPTLRADFIMANPPFNLSDWGADKLADDVRWEYGTRRGAENRFRWSFTLTSCRKSYIARPSSS